MSPHHFVLVHDIVRHAVNVLPLAGHDGDSSLPRDALHVLLALHRRRRVHAEHLQDCVKGMHMGASLSKALSDAHRATPGSGDLSSSPAVLWMIHCISHVTYH